jgi:hypothetical protein
MVEGRVVWYRESSASKGLAGIHFRSLSDDQSRSLARCFDFFGKASTFMKKTRKSDGIDDLESPFVAPEIKLSNDDIDLSTRTAHE